MKKSILALVLGMFLVGLSTQNVSATNPISEEASAFEIHDLTTSIALEKETKTKNLFQRFKKGVQKFVGKVKAKFYKVAGMFDDPVRKWMWFWLLFGLLGIILITVAVIAGFGTGSAAVFRILWYLGWGSSLFSSVSFVIWIIKLIQG